ncbi:DnaB-like helicase C-terminal domain-containing protein [Alkalihalobacterium bogoriense]|uniref:DnaB-like helicase C-terminal domain-containing protein n=1 Tax=Alkalihalobacterium bogoriense TaxID=246272 RepID=UPI000479CD2C|nr:DnaB-like helicase C-terminal domain-containing protein [Alkalihalobacterium bogoriense]
MTVDSQLRLDKAKQRVPLLQYIEMTTMSKSKKIGSNTFLIPCPFCGKKSNHFKVDEHKQLYKSFNECTHGGDIITFMEDYEHLSKKEAIQKLLELANISSDVEVKPMSPITFKETNKENELKTNEVDFTQLIEMAHNNIDETDYFTNERGLTAKTINKYKLGYAKEGLDFAINNHPDIEEKPNDITKMYKYFLPIFDEVGKCSYFIPRRDDNSPNAEKFKTQKTKNLKGFSVQLLNERYLKAPNQYDVLFIVEGYFDALSIEEFDYPAIGLNSVSNVNKLIQLVKDNYDHALSKTFVIIPDNDEEGEKLLNKVNEEFSQLDIDYLIKRIPADYKDTNDFLKADREDLGSFLKVAVQEVHTDRQGEFLVNYFDNFFEEIRNSENQPICSGFPGLDSILNGGLYPGLYVLGGPTSLGKTAFVHQIADQIAENGIPTLYFSYEMSRKDLMARSLSRLSFIKSKSNALTDIEIKTGKANPLFLEELKQGYKKVAENIIIHQGNLGESLEQLEAKLKRFKRYHNRFVVVVDYLQIIKLSKSSSIGERSNIDAVVTRLKQISRDYNVPLLVISSLNRTNYNVSVGFESFKESGTIEYSADVVMGLQFSNVNQIAMQKDEQKKREMLDQLKKKFPRELELQILKNRFGEASGQIRYDYFTKYQFFREK